MKKMEDAMGDMAGMRRAIEKSEFDAVIAVSPENVRYVGDVVISTQTSIRDRLAMIVWAKGREPVYVICKVETGYVQRESWIQDVRDYKEFVTQPIDLLVDTLKELKLERGHVAIETEYLPAKYYNQLAQALPELRIGAAEPVFRRVRMFKTAKEMEILAQGFRGTEKAMMATYATVQVGETEKSLAERLALEIMRSGADAIAFNHINAGPNTGFPHMTPGDYRVQKGDIVKADSGGFYREYYSNVGRTAKVGKPSAEEKETWRKLRDIHHRIIDMLRPGNTGRQLFDAATKAHEQAGIPFPYAHNGHSIGLQVHEHPIISPHETLAYEPGMMSTVETRVRWVGKKGLHMEDLVEITQGTPIVHSTFFDNEEIFVV
ncbi:MAG: aminopeptidase P family protein [Proteobacteria bacterium]|nr:aminopeptidase P family protein [Pseudomonadota bacterium]MBI3499788.1 aminopeptidase P family protein [Pseudomonadota bacterium]